jgi:HEAT repeat protein
MTRFIRLALPAAFLCAGLIGRLAPGAGPDTSAADERILEAAKIGTDGPSLLAFFRGRTLGEVDAGKIRTLIKDLGDDDFQTREKATEELVKLGNQAETLLQQALKDKDIEVVRRAEECLRRIKNGTGMVDTAAARLVALHKPAGAAEVLLGYVPFANNPLVVEEVKTTLAAVAVTNGQVDKALLAALTDKNAVRRAAAGVALCRAGPPADPKPVRLLLADGDLTVRVAAAIALAEAHDRDAVPVLIDLLAQPVQSIAWEAEDVLCRLAQTKAPAVSLGATEASRQKCRDAWADWWAKNGAAIDLAKLEPAYRQLGRTMLVFLDLGRIQERDAKGKVLWTVDDVQLPLDAQWLPGNRILLAEHGANRVTERDLTGKVVWEKQFDRLAAETGPLVAQRLPNGNTFIATNGQVIEVDKTGKEVWSYNRPLESIRKAQKLPNGDIALVTSSQRYVRVNPQLKDIHMFEADVRTNGGRIDVLPNGNVIVPLKDSNRVVEYDPQGKTVWEVAIDEPVAAVRLPNGHTLITTLNQNRAVEVDGIGKEIWEYKANTRVTRAWRR